MLSKEIQLEVNKGAMLPLMEEFYTIQGEGYHTGTAAYFIRIGGCDGLPLVRCERKLECRVASSNRIDLIVQNASKYAETVVVTGGEPLMWDMSLLTNKLKDVGRKYRNLRAYPLSGTWDWICLRRKKQITNRDGVQCSP
jgi:organic radical activating enzyme